MALGCVVARLGLLLCESGGKVPRTTSPGLSTGFGVMLVLGAALMIRATLRYRTTMDASDRTLYRSSPGLIVLFMGGLVLMAARLAVYLVLTA